jgi:hypothetical protein
MCLYLSEGKKTLVLDQQRSLKQKLEVKTKATEELRDVPLEKNE